MTLFATLVYFLSFTWFLVSYYMHFYVFTNFLVLFYFITFTPKCFALAVTAASAELREILLYKICKI